MWKLGLIFDCMLFALPFLAKSIDPSVVFIYLTPVYTIIRLLIFCIIVWHSFKALVLMLFEVADNRSIVFIFMRV
jgi:hypothetical protein